MTSWRMGPIRIGLSGEPGGGREMAFQLRREDTISFTVYEHYRPSGERLGPAVETVSKKIKVGDLFDSLKREAGSITGSESPWGKAAQSERERRLRQLLHGALEIAEGWEGWEGCDG